MTDTGKKTAIKMHIYLDKQARIKINLKYTKIKRQTKIKQQTKIKRHRYGKINKEIDIVKKETQIKRYIKRGTDKKHI